MEEDNLPFGLLRPMMCYLEDAEVPKEYLNRYLQEKNSVQVKRILTPLFEYGLVGVFVPFAEFLESVFDDDHLTWWHCVITELDQQSAMQKIQIEFHSRAIAHQFNFFNYKRNYPYSFDGCGLDVMEMLWESLCEAWGQNNLPKLPGYILPALCLRDLDAQTAILAKRYLGIFLEMEKTICVDAYVRAARKACVTVFSQELGFRLYDAFNSTVWEAGNLSRDKMSELRADDFKRMFLEDAHRKTMECSLDYQWVLQLHILSKLVAKYDIDQFSSRSLILIQPLLFQCIGDNDTATECIYMLSELLGKTFRRYGVLQLACYRAYAKESTNNQKKIWGIMDAAWGTRQLNPELFQTMERIIDFFDKLGRIMQVIIHEENRQDFINNVDPFDLSFYRNIRYLNLKMEGCEKKVYILFAEGCISDKFREYLTIATNRQCPMEEKIIAVYQFRNLLGDLSSHIFSAKPRVRYRGLCAHLGKRYEPQAQDEVFNIYSPSEEKHLWELCKRFQDRSGELSELDNVRRQKQLQNVDNAGGLITDAVEKLNILYDKVKKNSEQSEQMKEKDQAIARICSDLMDFFRNDKTLSASLLNLFVDNPELSYAFRDTLQEAMYAAKKNKELRKYIDPIEKMASLLDKADRDTDAILAERNRLQMRNGIMALLDLLPAFAPTKNVITALHSFHRAANGYYDRMMLNEIPSEERQRLDTQNREYIVSELLESGENNSWPSSTLNPQHDNIT